MTAWSSDTTRSRAAPEDETEEALALLISTANEVRVSPPLARGSEILLGRAAPGAPTTVLVADTSVSRVHAKIITANRLAFVDLGSRNGSKVDGVAAPPRVEVPLRVGSWIELASTRILLHRASTLGNAPVAVPRRPRGDEPIVRDPALRQLYATLDTVAPSNLSVLLLGETGVGKEVFAHEVHARSDRARSPFLCLNCAAIPEPLLEGELFGYEKGAFSGAAKAKAGLFEAADGGTVLLDEVAEIPLSAQAKLLRVLENGEVLRLGSLQPKVVDVRFISATHRDLRMLILEQRFRSDLFFRLNGVSFRVPPLRERVADIVPLAEHFAARRGRATAIGDDARRALESYSWPGNVRELRNVVERAVVMAKGREIGHQDLQLGDDSFLMTPPPETPSMRPELAPTFAETLPPPPNVIGPVANVVGACSGLTPAGQRAMVEEAERKAILEALEKTAGNQTHAAELLGITRRTLVYRIERYGIARPRRR